MGTKPSRLSRRARAPLLALLLWGGAAGASAQVNPDTVVVTPEPTLADTLGVADTLLVSDTVSVADTLPPRDLPRMPSAPPVGWGTATWSWDRDAFMGLRDLTLLELLEEVPGVVPLRGGDYGAPEAATALTFGAGRVRVFWDGVEMLALDGGAPDLALIGLGGLETVHVVRGPGELRIYLESMQARDPRPFSLVEAGTGDTDTNFFRGTFMHPRVLGGIFGFTLERVDTRGPFRREPGHRAGGWASWTRPIGEHFWLRAEGRRISRNADPRTTFPVGLERTDYVLRGRAAFLEGALDLELFSGGSTLESRADEAIVPVERSQRQHGVRLAWEPGPIWAGATFRLHDGESPLERSFELEGGGSLPRVGGAHLRWNPDRWKSRSATALAVHAWTVPFLGLSAFGSYGDGVRGAAIYPAYDSLPPVVTPEDPEAPEAPGVELPEPLPPGERFTDQSTLRLGASFQWRPLALHGAWLRTEVDSLPPLGLVLDRAGPTVPGGTFQGVEGQLRLALPIEGFSLNGYVQRWERSARYLPRTVYQASLDFHDVFLETRNLEVWGALGVKGRDPMWVPVPRGSAEGEAVLDRVPFYQNWYMDVQVRVLPVHIFIRWENFVLRENLQDYPGRRLPVTRAVYGVKWVLWN